MTQVKTFTHDRTTSRKSLIIALIAVMTCGIVGSYLLLASKAATPTASFETDYGAETTKAVAVDDDTASAGTAIKFSGTPKPTTTVFSTVNSRVSPGIIQEGGVYDYAPTIMLDGKYRMWWCGSDKDHPGDHIFYAESTSLNGPFKARDGSANEVVFAPTHDADTFDKTHTCDPSIIRANGTYYMYYGGLGATASGITEMGMATSKDGFTWTRGNSGKPIVVPARPSVGGYGAGQPSVSYYNNKFYLTYKDSTGVAGSAYYVLRSSDPVFKSGVEELTKNGFEPQTPANHTTRYISHYISADLQFSDLLQMWVHTHTDGTTMKISFWTPDFSKASAETIVLQQLGEEGPGIVSRPDKHAVVSEANPCGILPVDLITATRQVGRHNLDLKRVGIDIVSGKTCSEVTSDEMGDMLEGYALRVSGKPLTFITAGKRLQSATAAPIGNLTNNYFDTTAEVFSKVPLGASLHAGDPVIAATGKPAAFILDDTTRWPVNSSTIISSNQSTIKTVTLTEYNSYTAGASLYLVQ